MMEKIKTEPVVGRFEPDLRVYNVLINCGYVESARRATVICRHRGGFDTPEEALIHLHESLQRAFTEACQPHNYYKPFQKEGPVQALAEWISEYCGSDNDGAPGGYEMWEVLQGCGWELPGELVTGLIIELRENGAHILSSKQLAINHCRAYRGVYIPDEHHVDWPMTSDLNIYVLTVSKVKKRIPKKPKK